MRRLVLVGVALAFVVLTVAATFVANADPGAAPDDGHDVVVRNERDVMVLVRLSGTEGSVVSAVPARSEARLTPPATVGSVRDVMVFDEACVATGWVPVGGGGPEERWSDLSMLVVQADGSLGVLLPEHLDQWSQTRPALPAADARAAADCEEP